MTLALINTHGGGAMLRRPSHASSLSSHSSNYSSSSLSSSASLSSYSSALSGHKSPSFRSAHYAVSSPDDAEEVYVSSSSTILLGPSLLDDNTYDVAYDPNYYNSSLLSNNSSSSLHYDSANIRSIFYEEGAISEAQEISCFLEEDAASDGETEASHYEVIYEAINEVPSSQHTTKLPSRNDSDDSFDSEDSDEAYSRLEPQTSEQVQCLDEMVGDLTYERQGSVSSNGSQSITKLAEAANLGMWKLRKNWTQTKTEVKTGLNKIKKKGTFSSSDATAKSTENIYEASNSSNDGKRKWSFKNHFVRRKSTSSLVPPQSPVLSVFTPDKDKETATFYLTLTIETDKREAAAAAAEATQRLKGLDLLRNMELSDGVEGGRRSKSIIGLGRIADVDIVERPKSFIAALGNDGQGRGGQHRTSRPIRPKNAPPAPPSDQSESEEARTPDSEVSKEKMFAMRLNQVLSAGPSHPRGRRVLKSSHSVTEESPSSPVPVLLSPEAQSSPSLSSKHLSGLHLPPQKSSTLKSLSQSNVGSNHSLRHSSSLHHISADENASQLPEDILACVARNNLPNTRSSIVSSNSCSSTDGYIKPSDISSIPPPLPARPSSQQRIRKPPDDSNSAPTTPLDTTSPSLPEPCPNNASEASSSFCFTYFPDEPLYQFYAASVLERASHRLGECSSEDDYEVINDGTGAMGLPAAVPFTPRPTAMEIVTPTDGRRTLWCELKEVVNSGILNSLSSSQRKVQEAMFEVITSEASYLKSLDVLVSHFLNCPAFSTESIITKREKNILFSDILPVKRCSEMFLVDLEKRWQESVLISTIADIVLKHASSTFNIYVKYCSNQIYQDRMLKQLKENNPRFLELLTDLESSPKCQSLAMHSFLMLPMQRITRLPLLLDAIFHRLEHGSPQWHECNLALATLNKVVTECNEGARKMERMEEMLIISRQLDFREVKAVPLISASRWLVKKGELTRLIWRDLENKLTFGKRISKHTLYFFLFTDLLVVTKKKSDDSYAVLDHCPRNMVQVLELDSASDKNNSIKLLEGQKNLLIVTMLQNHENRTVEMVLSCARESERTRWVEAVTPRTSDNPDEQIYEEWDCPQVQATHAYSGSQPDELSLEVSDVVNVLKKMADGWYQGERLRDGERGWFPSAYCKEIASSHIRARNLRQRYRLLTLSSSMVEELRRNSEEDKSEKEEKKERRKTVTIQDVIGLQGIK